MAIIEEVGNVKGLYLVECPGCENMHHIPTKEVPYDFMASSDRWTFNGNMEKPTFSPSLNIMRFEGVNRDRKYVCHSFIRDGHWQFLNDCTHKLAGQTVPMIEID